MTLEQQLLYRLFYHFIKAPLKKKKKQNFKTALKTKKESQGIPLTSVW